MKLLGVLAFLVIVIVGFAIGLWYVLNPQPSDHIVKHVGSIVSNGEECAAVGG